jgi:hypothetical protein
MVFSGTIDVLYLIGTYIFGIKHNILRSLDVRTNKGGNRSAPIPQTPHGTSSLKLPAWLAHSPAQESPNQQGYSKRTVLMGLQEGEYCLRQVQTRG